MSYKFRMQPVVVAADGVHRFAENRIVRKLLTLAQERGYGLNEIAVERSEGKLDPAEVEQLTQLIGYSVSGFCTLSTSSAYAKRAAWEKSRQLQAEESPSNA